MDSFDVVRMQNIAYVDSQIACAYVELEAMKAENSQRERQGQALAWNYDEFFSLIIKYQLGHNSVLSNLHGGL